MAIEITMPRMSDTMEEGTLVKWRVKVGDKVASGDTLADVETDKATMELQAYDDGTVATLSIEEGQTLPVGDVILILAEEGEDLEKAATSAGGGGGAKPADKPAAEKAADTPAPVAQAPAAPAGDTPAASVGAASVGSATAVAPSPSPSRGRVKASPLARKLAEDQGIDLAQLQGSGPGGRIIKRDILDAAAGKTAPQAPSSPAPQAPAPQAPALRAGDTTASATAPSAPTPAPIKLESKTLPVGNMRKTIARRLVESKTTVPHFTVTVAVDMDPLLNARVALNDQFAESRGKLSVTDLITRSVALAITRHPLINSSWTDAGIELKGAVNIGMAVSLPEEKGGGLVVPVLRDAQNKSLWQLGQETKALANKARTTGLTIEEMSDGTFTISNLGMFGVEHFEAIINPPQAAILAVGSTVEKPVVREGRIVVGREMTLTLSADHRVVDGAIAAEFLATLKTLIQSPITLLA